MAEPPCILPLPTPLILLLHLHIMLYPHCNSPEYSPESIFVPRRPLRERAKTMEDIVAFLIEKIEGREKCKSVLGGIYPCLQPSDTVKFRANAAKYIETLRATVTRSLASKSRTAPPHSNASEVAFTSSKANSSTKSPSRSCKPQSLSPDHQPVAWWWTSVVVRKSLLEECSGDRFEKLLLALSTHALYVRIPPSSSLHPKTTTITALTSDLQLQSQAYASALSQSLELHEKRIHAVTRLNVRAQQIMSLRTRLSLNPKDVVEKPDTKGLLAIRDSKWRGLVDAWETTLSGDRSRTDNGMPMATEDMLGWLMSLAGVSAAADQHAKRTSLTGLPPDADVLPQYPRTYAVQSLPTASAHHPAKLYKLGLLPTFVFFRAEESSDKQTSGTDSKMSSPVLQELLDNAASQQSALKTALASAVSEGREVSRRLDDALKTTAAAETRDVENEQQKPQLWIPGPMEGPKFGLPLTKTSAVLECLDALNIAPSRDQECEAQFQQRLETRVLTLRDSLQPPIPAPVAPYEDLAQELPRPETPPIRGKHYQGESKLPLAKSSFAPPNSPECWHTTWTPRPYQTSTPPTKSRSKSARTMKRTLQEMRSGIYQSPKPSNNALTADVSEVRVNSGEHVGLQIPTGLRTSVPLCSVKTDSMLATRPGDMIADMSLPDFSEGSIIEHTPQVPGNCIEGFPRDHEDEDEPYEGHSITLRDILIRTGNGEDTFHLISNRDDLEDDVGNETTGWG